MASTVISIPGYVTGLSMSVRVRSSSDLSLLETVTLSESSNIYSGVVVGAHSGRLVFEILVGTAVSESRIRTIADDVGPYTVDSSLEVAETVDGMSVGTSSGPFTVTLSVEDTVSVDIQNANVRLNYAADDFTVKTSSNGTAVFGLDAATYNVTITKTGYVSYTGTLIVSADATIVIQLTASGSIPVPSDPLLSTGVLVAYDQFGVVEPSVDFTVSLTAGTGTAGYSLDTQDRVSTSDAITGLVTFEGLIRGATYSIMRGTTVSAASGFGNRTTSTSQTFIVPNSATFDIVETIGEEA